MADPRRKQIIRRDVIRRDGLNCCFCNKQLSNESATLEHIVPVSRKGSFNRTNLTISCQECNSDRGDQNFFDYIKNFNLSEEKILKYRKLYSDNLKIKILNLAKNKCIQNKFEVPKLLINQACLILKIKHIDFSKIECYFNVNMDNLLPKQKIRSTFENVIRIIESL